ncbi:hypothetical protein [Streptomyces xanthophaeus]|uniref:Uncharacterized protein n=1 Tax=Streptomyces xanthophaeus TaxID=67385 RepID=A0A919LD21_9ACTN|nr:hypothetical protein [Streptomyces xanthophaeus]GHI90378.1 hypothetical protein Sxan_77420 [Streptomyces xanthophaeus]
MSALLSFGMIDNALRKLGATRGRHPADYGATWIDHLAWGADSAFIAARLLFSGQYVGAAAVLRSQFERWTENAAYNAKITHVPGESTASFTARAWEKCHDSFPSADRNKTHPSFHLSPDIDSLDFWEDERTIGESKGPSVTIGKDYQVYPEESMTLLSEFLHGRGPFADVFRWEASELLSGEPARLTECTQWLTDVLTLNLRQIRLCLATLAEERGDPNLARFLFALPERTYGGWEPPAPQSLFPLMPQTGLSDEILNGYRQATHDYDQVMLGRRPAGRLFRDDEMVRLLFYERRARAAKWAKSALNEEKALRGDEFNLDGLTNRDVERVMCAEMAGLASVWLGDTPHGNAAAMCSSALRSAHWLWLEDDDRSMALLRVALEQCARLKVWTNKPEKAQQLEESSSSTPKDWLNAAGWKRLSSLNRALGEFAHAHARIRLGGAREILTKIQPDGDSVNAIRTARGHALDGITSFIMAESSSALSKVSVTMQEEFQRITNEFFPDPGGIQSELEGLLDRAMLLKNAPMGDYTFHGPARDAAAQDSN